MEKLKKIDRYLILYISVIAFYCLYLARLGFELWDTGYIPSFSWRILNGENAYEDFLYKGPPVTLYFHAFFMKILPETGQFYYIRVTNYLLFAIQVFFSVSAFDNFYKLQNFNLNKWAIMSVCFIISLLNFSPYPWPTTDGVFFASVAIYILSFKAQNFISFFFIALFCILSALCKQSFYPIPLLISAWIFVNYGIKKNVLFIFFLTIQICIFLYWISSITSISKFIKLTTGETSIGLLFYSGFLNYFWIYENKWFIYLFVLIISIAFLIYTKKLKSVNYNYFIKIISIVLVLFSIGLCIIHEFFHASRVAFLSCAIALIYHFEFKLKTLQYYSTLLLFLGIAWCCSISLGYPFPILFSTGIILSIILLFKNEIEAIRKSKLLIPISLFLCLLGFSYTIYPYREKAIYNLNTDLGEVSPKLEGLKSTRSNLDKLNELKRLKNKFGNRFIVAPNIPMAHYLFNSNSVMPADWIINSEINKNPKLFIDVASDKKKFIFLEKSFLKGEEFMPPKKVDFSIISDYIYRNFKKIEETKYFIIYNGIEKNEQIPKIN